MSGKPLEFFDPPPVRYMGSKWQLAEWIIDRFPSHDCYVEPYCGGAAVFFRKHPSPIEVLNDLNGDIINFFDCLRTRTSDLIRAIELTPYARVEYERSYQPCDDPLERARRFYIRSRMSFGSGEGNTKTGWRTQHNLNRRVSITKEWQRLTGLWLGAERLRDAQIECADALTIIKRYDSPRALFYIDPPYVLKSRRRAIKRYHVEMTDADHEALAAVLHQVQGSVLLSGYHCALYDRLYADWHSITKTTTTNGNNVATESLWISPLADERRHPMFGANL